jgi:hypothetical protein
VRSLTRKTFDKFGEQDNRLAPFTKKFQRAFGIYLENYFKLCASAITSSIRSIA